MPEQYSRACMKVSSLVDVTDALPTKLHLVNGYYEILTSCK